MRSSRRTLGSKNLNLLFQTSTHATKYPAFALVLAHGIWRMGIGKLDFVVLAFCFLARRSGESE